MTHRGCRRTRARRRARRTGFTLVEVVFSIAMLGGVLLGFAAFTRNFVRATNGAALRASASDLAVARIEAAKASTTYAGVDAFAATEAVISGAPGYARRTVIRRTQTTQVDYKTVTVSVTNPALRITVNKTTAIAAF